VKAIASGNAALLTLAETDAELQRLAILKKNHADDQFIARRKVITLPDSIQRLETRLASLLQDSQTIETYETDGFQVTGIHTDNTLDALEQNLSRCQTSAAIKRYRLAHIVGLSAA
jgi:hypothetical protein